MKKMLKEWYSVHFKAKGLKIRSATVLLLNKVESSSGHYL